MTIFARTLPPLARRRPESARGRIVGLALLTVVAALLIMAPSAGAVVSEVGGTPVGLQPRSGAYPTGKEPKAPEPKSYANAAGNPVLHGGGVYAIYWDPTDSYHGDWQSAIDTYFQNAGTASGSLASVFAVDTQYTDKSNRPATYQQAFKGAYVDYHAYPASGCADPNPFALEDQIGVEFGGAPTAVCLTSAQIASRLEAFIAQDGLPKGLGNVYYVLTPPGVTVCLDGGGAAGHCSDYKATVESYDHSFCSYHSDINPGGLPTGDGNTIVYAVIPWTAGGYGDGHLLNENDQRPGWECQDGGIYASPKGYVEEKAKEKNKEETEKFEHGDKEEKKKIEEAEVLEGPHEEEPNQLVPCPDSDGTCDYGLADLIISQIGLEQQNMVTDPLLNAWLDSGKNENTDECRFLFGPLIGGGVAANPETSAGTLYNQALASGTYYINDSFSLAALRLQYPGVPCLRGVSLDPKFTSPNPVNSGEVVGFDGMESDISLDAGIGYSAGGSPQPNYATYTWNYGDGTPIVSGFAPGSPACEVPFLSPCAASAFHVYKYGGNYEVTLTVRDVGGNTTSVTHEITVDGPPAPKEAGPGGTAGAGASTPGGSSPAAGSPGVPAPVAAAAVVSRTLKSALRGGLVVRYSVNEQVAGHFEVLLSRSIARSLGIGGAPAVGLPVGTAPQLVIAKAILVTTAGGRNTVKIQFSKHVASRLARLHKVSLLLRLIVRNGATHQPATTTVLSKVTLVG